MTRNHLQLFCLSLISSFVLLYSAVTSQHTAAMSESNEGELRDAIYKVEMLEDELRDAIYKVEMLETEVEELKSRNEQSHWN